MNVCIGSFLPYLGARKQAFGSLNPERTPQRSIQGETVLKPGH
jgi:hypothetical protein